MDRPSENTACVECHAKGHFCQAVIFVGKDPLCMECADGEPCLVMEAKQRTAKLNAVMIKGEEVLMSPHAVMGPEFIDPFEQQPREGKTMTEKKRNTGQVSLEVRKAIAEADPQIPHSELATRLGCSDVTVIKYRKQAGVFVPKKKAGRESAVLRMFKPKTAEIANDNGHAAKRITVPLEFDEEESVAIFRSLPAAEKASILGGVLRARLGL